MSRPMTLAAASGINDLLLVRPGAPSDPAVTYLEGEEAWLQWDLAVRLQDAGTLDVPLLGGNA